MTQTVPATCVLGPGKTGLTIGYRVLNLDGTEYSAFSTSGVAETAIAGTYRVAGGVEAPLAGGYVVWGTELLDYAEATVESASANVTMQAGVAVAAADANGNVPVVLADSVVHGGSSAQLRLLYFDAEIVGSYVRQTIRDAMKLAPTTGAAEAGSVDAQLGALALIGGLSGATVTVVSSVDGGTVTVYAADTWRFTVLSDQLALADYETLGLIVKRSARQADTQALLYLRTDTGLVRMDGAAPVSAGNGVLTKTATSFTAVVHVAETQGLAPGGYRWWLKGLDTTPAPDEAVTLATGEFVVLAAGLQAVG